MGIGDDKSPNTKSETVLGRGGVLVQGKGSGSWVKKRLLGILAVTGYGSI